MVPYTDIRVDGPSDSGPMMNSDPPVSVGSVVSLCDGMFCFQLSTDREININRRLEIINDPCQYCFTLRLRLSL